PPAIEKASVPGPDAVSARVNGVPSVVASVPGVWMVGAASAPSSASVGASGVASKASAVASVGGSGAASIGASTPASLGRSLVPPSTTSASFPASARPVSGVPASASIPPSDDPSPVGAASTPPSGVVVAGALLSSPEQARAQTIQQQAKRAT